MAKNIRYIILLLILGVSLFGCGPHLQKLTPVDIDPGYKTIFVWRGVGFGNNNVVFKIEDYLKKKGWNVLHYHRKKTQQEFSKIFKEAYWANRKSGFKKAVKSFFTHPDCWWGDALLRADYIVAFEIKPVRKSYNERRIRVYLYKMMPAEKRLENLNFWVERPKSIRRLAEKEWVKEKDLVYAEGKMEEYAATAAIMMLREANFF